MSVTIVPQHESDCFEAILRAVTHAPDVVIEASGQHFTLPAEMVDVVSRAADFFAGGRALDVVPQARARFL